MNAFVLLQCSWNICRNGLMFEMRRQCMRANAFELIHEF